MSNRNLSDALKPLRARKYKAKPLAATEEDCRTITRADLAEAIYKSTSVSAPLSRADCAHMVEITLAEIFDRLVAREDVKLSCFGAFTVRAKKERVGRNPKTGADAKISARLVVVFKASNVMRARINGQREASE
jgi:integration host factor subunit alpha